MLIVISFWVMVAAWPEAPERRMILSQLDGSVGFSRAERTGG
jgi:hypothetical protein